jgi:hypothetical protein
MGREFFQVCGGKSTLLKKGKTVASSCDPFWRFGVASGCSLHGGLTNGYLI